MTKDTSNTPQPDSDDVLDNITDIEKYFLHSKSEIVHKLRLLASSKSSLTGYFNNGNEFFLTAVIDVLRDKNILVLDITHDSALNKKITEADHLVFKTKHLGISAQFNTSSVQTAKFQGEQHLACEIPEDLLWVQRREDYRVHIPMNNNAVCQIKNSEGTIEEYRIIDVSGNGLAIADENFALNYEAGDQLTDVNLIFEEDLSCTTNLVIQNKLPLNFSSPAAGQRLGCQFVLLQPAFSTNLHRFINTIDSQHR